MLTVSILDGYVDEPTCLGVPPYISPYPRYIAGSIWNHNKKSRILYFTIDQLRNDKTILDIFEKSDLIVVIAGTSVPGRYLSGFPVSPNELTNYLTNITKPLKVICGPAARYGFGLGGGKKVRDIDSIKDVFDLIINDNLELR